MIYSIDPYRPSTWLRSVERLRTEGVERVILPWWTAYWALCYDKPVVATRVGGLPEVVDEGLSGFIVEPADATALAGALERCRGFVPCPETMRTLKQKMSWDSLARTLIQSGPALDPQYPGSKSPQ